jgi:glycosyltransferase involved in cell wall biosynthesis
MNNIGIFAINTWAGGVVTSMNNLTQIFKPIFDDILLVTTLDQNEEISVNVKNADNISYYTVNHKGGGNKFSRIFNMIWSQIRISYNLLRIIRKTDAFLFLGELLVLPMIIGRIFGKKTYLSLPSSQLQMNKAIGDSFNRELEYISRAAFLFSSVIIVYTPNIIKEWNLEKYEDKVVFAHEQYIDFEKFRKVKDIDERENLIGYIGRLSPEKGVENFVKAIPQLSKTGVDRKFLIIGDGNLRDKMESYLDSNDLNRNTELLESIDHDEIPGYLNKLKLLVMPSYTEGLPNIMLEAMACGTPVLATPVGGIPDIIVHGKNGFIMEDNSPQSIADAVEEILENPNYHEISENAKKTVKNYFKYETVVKNWTDIFSKVDR